MLRYNISYNKNTKDIVVLPDNLSAGSNYFAIGNFSIENPNQDVQEYKDELTTTIMDAIRSVGIADIGPYRVRITDYKTGEEQTVKERDDELHTEQVPLKDQVPVTEETTAAEAAYQEQQKVQGQDVLKEEPDTKPKSKKKSEK